MNVCVPTTFLETAVYENEFAGSLVKISKVIIFGQSRCGGMATISDIMLFLSFYGSQKQRNINTRQSHSYLEFMLSRTK